VSVYTYVVITREFGNKKENDQNSEFKPVANCLNVYSVIYFKSELPLTFMEYKIRTGTLRLANGTS